MLSFAPAAQAYERIPSKDQRRRPSSSKVWPLAMRDLSWFIASDHVIVPSINDTAGLPILCRLTAYLRVERRAG